MRIISSISLLIFIILSLNVCAQQGSQDELRKLFTFLKSFSVYSFEAEINASFPDGTKQRAFMTISMDKPGKRLYYSNDDQTLLVTPQWAYQAFHRQKKASVFNVSKYNQRYKDALPEIQQIFSEDILSFYVDSVLLKIASIQSVKKQGNVWTYKLAFPSESIIKEMSIVMNYTTNLPEMISLKTFQHSTQSVHNKGKEGLIVETICRNYRHTISEDSFNTSKFFVIKAGKAFLIKNKNYQLTSIL